MQTTKVCVLCHVCIIEDASNNVASRAAYVCIGQGKASDWSTCAGSRNCLRMKQICIVQHWLDPEWVPRSGFQEIQFAFQDAFWPVPQGFLCLCLGREWDPRSISLSLHRRALACKKSRRKACWKSSFARWRSASKRFSIVSFWGGHTYACLTLLAKQGMDYEPSSCKTRSRWLRERPWE